MLLGRKLYEYRIRNNNIVNFNPKDLNWPFPAKYYQSIGYTVHGFSFKFKNTDNKLSVVLNPNDDLINIESGVENTINNLTEELFSNKKTIKQKIAEYNVIPIKNFINESFFLYDRSNAIRKTFVTAIDKELSIYGSFSYFSGKTSIKNIKLIDVTNPLKFLVEKKSLKDNLKFKIAYVNGSDVNTEDKKIHDFPITKLGKRRKNMLSEPVETLIVRAQQNFDVVGGFNPIQVQITDDTALNLLKKYKNVAYRVTPIGLLFPASIKNSTDQMFLTFNNLSGVKKSILNYKIYNLLACIDLNKINIWEEILKKWSKISEISKK